MIQQNRVLTLGLDSAIFGAIGLDRFALAGGTSMLLDRKNSADLRDESVITLRACEPRVAIVLSELRDVLYLIGEGRAQVRQRSDATLTNFHLRSHEVDSLYCCMFGAYCGVFAGW